MSVSRVDLKLKIPFLLALFSALGLGLTYFFNVHSNFLAFLSSVFRPAIAGAALLASVFALRNYWENFESTLSRIWLASPWE